MTENSDKKHISLVVCGHVDAGKCFRRDTMIKLYSGKNVPVQEIKQGDMLMGDDSTPRQVVSTTSGYAEMFDVVPTYGQTYNVNADHVLSLKATGCKEMIYDKSRDRYRVRWLTVDGLRENSFSKAQHGDNYQQEAEKFLESVKDNKFYLACGDTVDMPVKHFQTLSKSSQDMFKGFATGVDYEMQKVDLDPYMLGLWLGDGSSQASEITNADDEIVDYLNEWATNNGMEVRQSGKFRHVITSGTDEGGEGRNVLTRLLKQYNVWGEKHIPDVYKFNDRNVRLALLAGIIDSDGYMNNNCYDITLKNERLAFDTIELAQSLGFKVTHNYCEKTCYNSPTMATGQYLRFHISGEGLEEIPNLLARKKCQERQSKKNALVSGIKIEPTGEDDYFGFELDGNGRFLLNDFTVTHNSTTTGHLIFKLGGLGAREMEKLQAEADAQGMSSFAFAYYMDRDKAERERGVTINCTTKEFYTDTYHYTIVDAPGHRDYVKNMITGAGCADVALLLVPAEMGGFETAIAKGDHKTGAIQGQTRQHARLLSLLGVEQLVVGINKMDSCDWSETRYNEIKEEMTKMIQQAGFKPKKVPFIPFSGFKGENLVEKSDKMPWYKGWEANISKEEKVTGVTLYDAFEKLVRPPKRNTEGKVRVPINGIYKIKGVGDVITGRVEQGIIRPNDVIGIAPRNLKGLKVFSVEMHHKSWPQAIPGDNVGLNIKGLEKGNMPKVGDVIYLEKEGELLPVKKFKAQVAVQEHPGQLKVGFAPLIHVRTGKASCRMNKIYWKMGKKTGNQKVDNPDFLEMGEAAEVEFIPKQPIYLESFSDCQGLGRIAVMDSNQLVMLGKVLEVEYGVEDKKVLTK